MNAYKRNQVEEALSRVFNETSAKPSSELRTRIKRLLDMDRSLGCNRRSENPETAHYAFYHGDSPGRGVEVWFSEYEAFALMTGLLLLRHSWPQSFAVALLRRVRADLEKEHARILRQDTSVLFNEEEIRSKARPGDLYFGNTDPVLLTIVSGDRPADASALPCAICRGMTEVSRFVKQQSAQSWSMFELVTPAHALAFELSKAEPRKRGRGG